MAGKTFRRTTGQEPMFFEVEKDDGGLIRFDCRPQIPGGVLLAFTSGGAQGATENDRLAIGRSAIQAVRAMFRHAIVKAQQEHFWAMINGESEDGLIDVGTMMEIAEYLSEAYAERPTGEPSGSGSPTTSNGSRSTDGAPPMVSTYSRLTPVGPSTSSSTGGRSVPL